MSVSPPLAPTPRRSFLGSLAAGTAALAGLSPHENAPPPPAVTCFIHYELDPFQRDAFAQYAGAWTRIIPRCGGDLLGYFLPYEGTNYVAYAVIAFKSLAAYETYRVTLRADAEAQANFAFAQSKRFILREERTFLERVRNEP